MNSLPLSDATRRMAAPPSWDHERDGICHTLEICDRDGWMISAWQPTAAELERLNQGHPIFLHIQGVVHPVVSLSVGGLVDEASCPGHVASENDPKICGRCGVHIDSLRPPDDGDAP